MSSENFRVACVFGLFETGLGVIRSLAVEGVKVIGIDYKKDIAWYSRYSISKLCPNPAKEEKKFLDWILKEFSALKENRLPAFVTGDDFLTVFLNNRDFLEEYFLFNFSTNELLFSVIDKYKQFKIASGADIPVPQTWLIQNENDLIEVKNNRIWPLFMKGQQVNEWRKIFGGLKKGFVVNDYKELAEHIKPAIEARVPVIVQEIITGPDTQHFKYCAYISGNGEILAELCLQKIRQNPPHYGIGSLVISIQNSELLELGRKFMRNINFKGVGSAEFKLDDKDNKFKLIELNPRYWQQNALSTACKVNFAYINYLDLTGKNPKAQLDFKAGIKWINVFSDFNSFLIYKKENKISLFQWFSSIKGKIVLSVFSIRDPLPLLNEIHFGKRLFKIPFYLIRKIFI